MEKGEGKAKGGRMEGNRGWGEGCEVKGGGRKGRKT